MSAPASSASGPSTQISACPSSGRNAAYRPAYAASEAAHPADVQPSPTRPTAAVSSAKPPASPPWATGTKCRANPASSTARTTSGESRRAVSASSACRAATSATTGARDTIVDLSPCGILPTTSVGNGESVPGRTRPRPHPGPRPPDRHGKGTPGAENGHPARQRGARFTRAPPLPYD